MDMVLMPWFCIGRSLFAAVSYRISPSAYPR